MNTPAEKICMFTPSSDGGHALYTSELLTALSAHPRGGDRFELVTSEDLVDTYRTDRYLIHPILPALVDRSQFVNKFSWVSSRLTHYARRDLQFLRWLKTRPDITAVHIQEWTIWLAAPMIRRIRAMGKRVFYTAHNIRPHNYPKGIPHRLVDRWIRSACRQCDCIFVHTSQLERELLDFVGEQCPPVRVSPHGVWTIATKSGESIAQRLERKRLLVFGAIRRNKGLHLLLEAAGELRDFHITIAGDPRERAYFESEIMPAIARARQQGVSIDLRARFVPDDEVADLFATHSAIMLPYTRDFVAQSGVVFMALAHGIPVVASAVGGLKDLLDQHPIGTQFSEHTPAALAHAVRRLYCEVTPRDLEIQIDLAREQFSWKASATATLNGYASVLEGQTLPNDCAIKTTAAH